MSMTIIDTPALRDLLAEGGVQFVDVRLADDFEAAHIPGSVNNCVLEVAFADRLSETAPDKGVPVAVYGASPDSHESRLAADKLARLGYLQIYDYRDGMAGWHEAGYGFETGEPLPAPPSAPHGHVEVDLQESALEWTGRNLLNKHHGSVALKSGHLEFDDGRLIGGAFVKYHPQPNCIQTNNQPISPTKMKATIFSIPFALAAGLLVSCENPADETEDAQVGAEREQNTEATPDDAVRYVFADGSKIEFEGSKVTGSHTGGFNEFSGHFFILDGQPVGGDHQVNIDMTSVFSDNEKLTGHLKSVDFFEVETYPTATFDNVTIEKTSDSEYTVTGNLEMKGVTKSVSFPATVAQNGDDVQLTAAFDINRTDWGIVYKGKADDLIREEVVLRFDLKAQAE